VNDENSYYLKPAVVDVTVDNPSASGQADIIGKPNRKTTLESDTGEALMMMMMSMMIVMMILAGATTSDADTMTDDDANDNEYDDSDDDKEADNVVYCL
jgi:hypothetical protein